MFFVLSFCLKHLVQIFYTIDDMNINSSARFQSVDSSRVVELVGKKENQKL